MLEERHDGVGAELGRELAEQAILAPLQRRVERREPLDGERAVEIAARVGHRHGDAATEDVGDERSRGWQAARVDPRHAMQIEHDPADPVIGGCLGEPAQEDLGRGELAGRRRCPGWRSPSPTR